MIIMTNEKEVIVDETTQVAQEGAAEEVEIPAPVVRTEEEYQAMFNEIYPQQYQSVKGELLDIPYYHDKYSGSITSDALYGEFKFETTHRAVEAFQRIMEQNMQQMKQIQVILYEGNKAINGILENMYAMHANLYNTVLKDASESAASKYPKFAKLAREDKELRDKEYAEQQLKEAEEYNKNKKKDIGQGTVNLDI
jgi:hypothetical protein